VAQEDVPGGLAPQSDPGDGEAADEWAAGDFPDAEAVEPPVWDKRKGPKPISQVEAEAAPVVEEIDPDEELPPEPNFLIVRNAYGPGAHSVKFADGKPVGQWMREQEMTPEEVEEQLTAMGLDADLIAFFVRTRAAGIAADASLAADPVVAAFAQEEERGKIAREETKAAFLAAYKKKQKEKS
jgi:hypothetical protein